MYPRPLNLPNEIPSAPRVPNYHLAGEAAWTEAWALGYNSGWVRGADAEYARGEAQCKIVEREREHIARECVHMMEQRDGAQEELDALKSHYRFLVGATIIVASLALAGGVAIGALFGPMV